MTVTAESLAKTVGLLPKFNNKRQTRVELSAREVGETCDNYIKAVKSGYHS